MHKIRVELVGRVPANQEIELEDHEALPKYVDILNVLQPDGSEPAKKTRRGRKPKNAEPPVEGGGADPAEDEDEHPTDPLFSEAS